MRVNGYRIGVVSALFGAAMLSACGKGDASRDVAEVRELLFKTYDKPGAPLTVEPVVIEDDIAVAGWSQGEVGGRAALRRRDGRWGIVLCAGDALKTSENLQKLGMSPRAATNLAENLARAERNLPAATLQQFSKFDAIVEVDAAGGHSPADPHHIPLR